MRILFSLFILGLLTSCLLPAQSTNTIYKLPETESEAPAEKVRQGYILAGTDSGLYKINESRTAMPLWTEGKVSKIVHTQSKAVDGSKNDRWFLLTSKGIVTTSDLVNFEYRNAGLAHLTIKESEGNEITFTKQCAQLKDLEVHPENSSILVTATKDNVYITYDAGLSWKNIGSSSATTSGIKAVAVADIEGETVAFMAHAIYGFAYKNLSSNGGLWHDCTGGFEALKSQTYPDEISDILPVVFKNSDGSKATEIFISQTFIPRIYRFDWSRKRGNLIYSGSEPTDTIDGLLWDGANILYTRPGHVAAFNPAIAGEGHVPESFNKWNDLFDAVSPSDTLYSAWIPDDNKGLVYNELWLLHPERTNNLYSRQALDRKAVYCPPNHVTTQAGIDKYRKILRDNKLNALVIDMKDDYGLLRYVTNDPLIKEKGYLSRYHIDIDSFVKQFKEDGVYLVARIVTFKDKNLSQYANGKYAIWDKTLNRPWVGTKGLEDVTDEKTGEVTQKMSYYDENWVDPYCPEVWEYDVHIAQELVARGFDEIQFDYIRFPTDGKNMSNALFRYKSEGMDKESALVSFLRYARKNIPAPLGIDIYGANGWYRSGTRTGQDVELLAEYVDVICPMFYPNHFENGFLNYAPWSERPYRIYFYGTYRNTVIGRNKLIIRPWVQAFYLNVSYDRQYYNSNYVRQEVFGVRDSVNRGYMYWNNSGRYDDISPDVGDELYTGPASEASTQFRKPALSSEKSDGVSSILEKSSSSKLRAKTAGDLKVWDSIRKMEDKEDLNSSPLSYTRIRDLWQNYSQGNV